MYIHFIRMAASNTVIGDVTNLVIRSIIPTYNIPVLILHSNLIKKI